MVLSLALWESTIIHAFLQETKLKSINSEALSIRIVVIDQGLLFFQRSAFFLCSCVFRASGSQEFFSVIGFQHVFSLFLPTQTIFSDHGSFAAFLRPLLLRALLVSR